MTNRRPTRVSEAGFTMVELMVSLVLFTVAIAGVLAVSVTLSTAFRAQRSITQAEASARGPMDFLTDVLRNASPGVPSGQITDYSAQPASTICTTPSAIVVTDSSTAPDSLEVMYASGAVVTATTTALVVSSSASTVTVESAAGISAGDYVIFTNTSYGIFIKVNSVSGNTLTLAGATCTTNATSPGYPVGTLVIRAQHAKFTIDATSVDGIPNLMMQLDPNEATPPATQPVADGVEDMQVAIGVDANNDGQITEIGSAAGDDEWSYNVAGETQPAGNIRAVRVTLIARAVNTNAGSTSSTYLRPAAEDRAVATTSDVFRRRALQSTVEIRNLVGSP